MQKIGIDARLFGQTGVGVYIRNLLHFLEKTETKNVTFCVYLMKKDYDEVNFSKNNFIKRVADYRWHSFSEQLDFLTTLNKDNLDLMHFTYFSYPFLYRRPFIATVHDLTPLFFKTGRASTKNPIIYWFKHFIFKLMLKKQIQNSKAIITPTETVRKQLIDCYGIQYQDKIKSIYEGVNYEFINKLNIKNISLNSLGFSNKPFFLYVGNFYPHKNVENLVKAFSRIKADYQLILIGPKDFFAERLFHCINTLKSQNKVLFFHKTNKKNLSFFYKNALALAHSSLSEGFGLPIVEAMYFNCPIIASDIPVFRELLGNQYLSFDPNNVDDIKNKIEKFILNKQTFDYKDILSRFSFEEMTKKTIEIYLRLTKN